LVCCLFLVGAKMALAGETCTEVASDVQTSAGKKLLVKKQKRKYQPSVKDFPDPQLYEADAEAKSEIETDTTGIAETVLTPTSASDQSQMLLEDVQDSAVEDIEKSSKKEEDSKDQSVSVSTGWGKEKSTWTGKHWSNEECKESGKYSSNERYPNEMAKKGKPELRDHCIYWDCQELKG